MANALAEEHHVVVVDYDPERLEKVRFESDVMTYEGSGVDLDVLRDVEVAQADMVIASTSDDQTNILICSTAKALSKDTFTIARVAETGYLTIWSRVKEAFNADLIVGSNDLTAHGIVRIAGLRTARHVELFAGGKVEMAELKIPPGSPIAGRTVKDTRLAENVNLAAVLDGDELEVIHGGTCLRPNTRLVVIGQPDGVQKFSREISPIAEKRQISRIVILGGGEIGYQTARLLEQQNIRPKLVEWDRGRANFLAENLPGTIVLQNDATDPDFLRREGVPDTEILVSAMRPDDRNLLTALMGKRLGAERSVSVVHNAKYEPFFVDSGVDVTLNPRREVIEEILRYTRRGGVKKISFVGHHRGEVVEIELSPESPLVGRPLKESAKDLPQEIVIGAVSREGRIIIPRGDTVLKAADHLVIFADTNVIEALETI